MDSYLSLVVAAQDATNDELAGITSELMTWIRNSAPDCEVNQQQTAGPPGAKGLLELLGRLGINLLAPDALKGLVDCLAVYIKERRRDVSITLEAASGAKLSLTAGGIGRSELDTLLRQLRDMMSGGIVART